MRAAISTQASCRPASVGSSPSLKEIFMRGFVPAVLRCVFSLRYSRSRCSRPVRKRRRRPYLPAQRSIATSLRRTRVLRGRRCESFRRRAHRDLDRDDLAAVADREGGGASAVDALADRHPAEDGNERHRTSLHHGRKPRPRAAGEAARLARGRGAGYRDGYGGAAAGAQPAGGVHGRSTARRAVRRRLHRLHLEQVPAHR